MPRPFDTWTYGLSSCLQRPELSAPRSQASARFRSDCNRDGSWAFSPPQALWGHGKVPPRTWWSPSLIHSEQSCAGNGQCSFGGRKETRRAWLYREVCLSPGLSRASLLPHLLAGAWPRRAQRGCLKGWMGRTGVEEWAAMGSPLRDFPLPPRRGHLSAQFCHELLQFSREWLLKLGGGEAKRNKTEVLVNQKKCC